MFANLFRSVAAMAANAVAAELRKPENRERLLAAAQQAAAKARDPANGERVEAVARSGMRALGRAYGNLKNR
jgi:hypothetical protein